MAADTAALNVIRAEVESTHSNVQTNEERHTLHRRVSCSEVDRRWPRALP